MVDFVSLFTGMSERDIGYLLKTIVQDSINSELTNSEITEIDEKTPVLITNSKDVELMHDIAIQSAVNIEPSTVYLMPEEPDGVNLKLWLKFQNVGELRDWSYQKNKSYSTGGNTMPGLFSKYNDNSMMKYELYSYFNGTSHYAYTLDAPAVRILPNITASKITSFFMRLVPISLAKVLYSDNIALFTKVDDDQLRYGYSVTLDVNGTLNFYVRNNYVQYHLPIVDAYNYILTDPLYDSGSNFTFEDYNKKNFLTGFEFLCSLVDAELPFHDWFFKYNPTTHAMAVINTTENNPAAVIADTSTVISPVPAISVPIQEGKWTHSGTVQTTVYDNSGNSGRNGTISNIATGGQWNDDNTLSSSGIYTNNIEINFSSISAINTLTEFTITFWFNPEDELVPIDFKNIVSKGINVAQSFLIYRDPDVNDVRFVLFESSGSDWIGVTFPNAFPVVNKWYFVVCKWKSGEKVKISVDNASYIESTTAKTFTLTNSTNNLRLFDSGVGAKGRIALFKFYTTQISSTVQDSLYYQGYHNPLFPKSENIQPVVEEDPDPVFVPFTNVYSLDKMATPVLADYRKINSLSGDNPFLSQYSVADGTSTVDPELNPYNIADGTGGAGSPFVRIGSAPNTIDSSDNSSGKVGDGQNDAYALQLFSVSSGIGQTINGKVITKAIFYMRNPSGSVTGTLYCRIWNATTTNLTPVATLGSMAASAVNPGSSGSDWVAYTFTNTANTVAMAANYRIGIEYQGYGSSDVIDIQRKSSPSDLSAYQTTYDGNWDSDGNNSFSVKCDLYTGLGTTSSDPNVIMKSGSYNGVVQAFGIGDSLIGKIIGKVTLRLKKVGSPTGTATVGIFSSASTPTLKATLGTINVSTGLTTTTADYTFSNYAHGYVSALTDRVGIIWTPSASGEVHVMTNLGNTGGSNTWNGTVSSVFTHISSWSATGFTTVDLAGKIYTGGNNFDAFIQFTGGVTRITTKAVNSSSVLHNRKITKLVSRMGKVGSPSGTVTATIRDANDVIRVQFSSVDVSTIPADSAYHDVTFLNVIHNYLINSVLGSGDKISFEYSSGNPSNYIEINSNHDVINGVNTITQTYNGVNYTDNAQRDLAGTYYSGGEPDLNSRTRVVQSLEHQNSILKGKKITRVKAFLIRTTTGTSGTAYCNIRRGTDDSLVKTLDTVAVSSLSSTPATPSEIIFEDTTNNYPLNVGDKVSIEFSGGNTTDQLGVLVREVTPNYDLSNSYIRKFDEVDYDDIETTKDLCAVMDEGGFFFVPDPNSIPDPTPTNIKDLLFGAGNNAKSGFLEAFLMEFRIYAKDITLNNADNLYGNRYSISAIGHGQILMPFSLKANTLSPV